MNETPRPQAPSPHVARLVELLDLDARPDSAIAAAAGLSRQHLHQVKAGARRAPSIDTVGAILEALGRKWADLDG